MYHSSRVLSKTKLPSPFASLILCCRHAWYFVCEFNHWPLLFLFYSPTDVFPGPSALLIADQLPGDVLLAAVHKTNSIAFYKLTMTSIPSLNNNWCKNIASPPPPPLLFPPNILQHKYSSLYAQPWVYIIHFTRLFWLAYSSQYFLHYDA